MKNFQEHIIDTLRQNGVDVYGFSDLKDIPTLKFNKFEHAISIAIKLDEAIVDSIVASPNQAYCDEYKEVNKKLDFISEHISKKIQTFGYNALPIPASKRTDLINIKGDFPHKTAATRAGLGWIGKSSLLITKKYGPRVRLSTILTDFPFEPAIPINKSFCGKCIKCIDACPANAITDRKWYPGLARKNLVDVYKCDNWKKTNYFDLCKGHVCGICMAVCHFGRKTISRT
ncbi:MAG: hypothetical protein SRB1_01436 [Desulfobacteraceae bacterium Eth-SRB1]|nr:MAG: hypothetical protein SRB1_01436 [Desulfobacteraceae bacterium Eth-SRB1]